ncbi:MAG: FISUMP domain-containing protein [Aureispira sp.]
MKDKIQVINNVLLQQKDITERKAYLESLGEEYQQLLDADDVFLDTRDYSLYSIVKIAGQEWLGENVRYETTKGSHIYDQQIENLHAHGRLYTIDAAQEACPEGWEVPDNKAWMDLLIHLGGYNDSYYDKHFGSNPESVTPKLLKGGSSNLDLSSGGQRYDQSFEGIDKEGFYWSMSPFYQDNGDKTIVHVWKDYGDIVLNVHGGAHSAFSLRCLRPYSDKQWVTNHNKALLALQELEERKEYLNKLEGILNEKIANKKIFLDERDYTLYSIVNIGNQYWLGENLRYDCDNAVVYNQETNPEFIAKYGRLYAPFMLDKSCPKNCSIPSLKDYETLFNHFQLEATLNEEQQDINHAKAGANLTQRGNSGFEAYYGGNQSRDRRSFHDLGNIGFFWTIDQEQNHNGHYYVAFHSSDGVYAFHEEHYDPIMASCRVLLTE